MSASAWRSFAVLLSALVPALGQSAEGTTPRNAADSSTRHAAVTFLHDRFHLRLASQFAAAALPAESRLPGPLGLSAEGQLARPAGPGYRQNAVPFQAGEYYWQGGAGEEIGVRAERQAWPAEPLGLPPSGADDPAMLPGPFDTAYFYPVPLYGYAAADLVFWRDPVLPDTARATAHYTNGPAGYSYTGGRLRSDLGSGFETDAQVYRIFSDGVADSNRYDGHNLDLEVRRTWGRVPVRVRFRQNRGDRDLVFRWQVDPVRAAHKFYLTHLTAEAALPGPSSEWLLSYDLRVQDQELRAVPALSSYQYWFERTHRFGLSRVADGPLSYWGGAAVLYRESDSAAGLPQAWMSDLEAGLRLSGSRAAWLGSAGARVREDGEAELRLATALRLDLGAGHAVLAFAGASREEPSTLRRYLPYDSGAVLAVSGRTSLPQAKHVGTALVWRLERRLLSWNLMVASGRSGGLPDWNPQGDTAATHTAYAPVPTDRSGTTLSGRVAFRPAAFLEVEGGWQHVATTGRTQAAAFVPGDDWSAALRLPLEFRRIHLRVIPQGWAQGGRGGNLPADWWSLSAGAVATLKHLTVFWFRDNLLDEPYRTGGAYAGYGVHSRFGFYWNFWN